MTDAFCKCFTHRLNRLVNCLEGFDDRVNIQFFDNEEFTNIVLLIREKIHKHRTKNYHPEVITESEYHT